MLVAGGRALRPPRRPAARRPARRTGPRPAGRPPAAPARGRPCAARSLPTSAQHRGERPVAGGLVEPAVDAVDAPGRVLVQRRGPRRRRLRMAQPGVQAGACPFAPGGQVGDRVLDRPVRPDGPRQQHAVLADRGQQREPARVFLLNRGQQFGLRDLQDPSLSFLSNAYGIDGTLAQSAPRPNRLRARALRYRRGTALRRGGGVE